jgi:hypothetical protein
MHERRGLGRRQGRFGSGVKEEDTCMSYEEEDTYLALVGAKEGLVVVYHGLGRGYRHVI